MIFYKANGETIEVGDGGGSDPSVFHDGISEISKKIFNGTTEQILLLGDSITAGAGGTGYNAGASGNGYDNTGYCWANVFKKFMYTEYGITVRNYGKYGSIASEQYNIYVNNKQTADDLVIWLSGTNNRTASRFADYAAYIGSYIEAVKSEKDLVMISCIPASQANEEGADKQTWQINDVLFNACFDKNANFISGYNLISEYCYFTNTAFSTLLADQAHPNDAGHLAMFKLFCYALNIPLPPYIDFSYGNYDISM